MGALASNQPVLLPRIGSLRQAGKAGSDQGCVLKPGSQNARILRALSGGTWVTVAEIHRRAGTCRLNSRVSELRKYGYVIEHETVPGKTGALGHRYRLLNPPSATELEIISGPSGYASPGLPRGDVPRDPAHRFRVYRTRYDELDLVATASTPEEVGAAIVKLGREGEFAGSCLGLLDTHGTDETKGSWVVHPWDVTP